MEAILGKTVSKELTHKQKTFAREVAMGATKADAYRKAYKQDASRATLTGEPYRVAAHPSVSAEIQAYQAAIEASKYRTPAALRELVIQSLVSVIIDPEAKDSAKISAAKVLGTVTEVAAFTERKEIRTIRSSEDARQKIIGEIKRLVSADATDVAFTETAAEDLLRELAGDSGSAQEIGEEGGEDSHHAQAPQNLSADPGPHIHSIPPEQSATFSDPPPSADPDSGDTPPSSLKQVP